MPKMQRCPKCNHLNSLDAVRCARCAASLMQTCPQCGTTRPWYVPRCPRCEAVADDAHTFTSLFRQAPTRRLQDRYVLRQTLATGHIGSVYRAQDTLADRTVVIKELPTTALIRGQERRAATSALEAAVDRWRGLTHPALAGVLGTFSERDSSYVVLEYIDGPTLADLVTQYGRIPEDIARNWGAQLALLLGYLHSQKPALFAPFLTPSHVLVDPDGRLKLADYGFSALFAPSIYGPYGSARGYAAPELTDTAPTPQSDVFALGRLLYALLTGQLLEQRQARQGSLRQLAPGISDALVKTIAQAAHREPDKRMSATRLALELSGVAEHVLEPLTDWRTQLGTPVQALPVRSGSRGRTASQATPSFEDDLMAQAGYERDPRFGPHPQEAPTPAPRGGATTTSPEAPPKSARLSVYPQQLSLENVHAPDTLRAVLTLRNTGEADIVGTIVSRVDWIRAPAKQVALAAGKQAKVVLSVRPEKLPAGKFSEPQALLIESNAGRQWVAVSGDSPTAPMLQVPTPVLEFGAFQDESERVLSLTIENVGRQPLSGKVVSRVAWLRPERPEVRCAANGTTTVQVRLLPNALPPGPQRVESALIIDSDGGQAHIQAAAHRMVPELDLGATHIDVGHVTGGEVTERYLYVGNTGDGILQGTARSLVPWLQVFPQEVVCAPGELAQLTASIDTAGLADGPIDLPQALRIQTNGGTRTLSLRLHVSAPRLVLPSHAMDFGAVLLGESKRIQFVLRNDGTAPLETSAQSLVGWLAVEPTTIQCPAGGQAAIWVTANTASFSHGQEVEAPAALRLVAGSTIVDIPASLAIIHPALSIEPSEIDFGFADPAYPETRTLTITNEGTGVLAWHAQADAQWVEVQPQTGQCARDAIATLTLTAYALAVDTRAGASARGNLIITSDGGRAKIPLRIALAAPMLATDTRLLDLGPSINRQPVAGSFRVFNHGLGILRGSLAVDQPWLVLDRASFACETGRSIEVRVSTDMEELPVGVTDARGVVHLTSNGGEADIEMALRVEFAAEIEPPDTLHLAPTEAGLTGRLLLRNVGMAAAHVSLQSSDPALDIARAVCDVKPGKSVRIALTWTVVEPPIQPVSIAVSYDGHPTLNVPVAIDE
ncbi:MAG: protein kinase domain-containing protein [Anaerolineae bacterium]